MNGAHVNICGPKKWSSPYSIWICVLVFVFRNIILDLRACSLKLHGSNWGGREPRPCFVRHIRPHWQSADRSLLVASENGGLERFLDRSRPRAVIVVAFVWIAHHSTPTPNLLSPGCQSTRARSLRFVITLLRVCVCVSVYVRCMFSSGMGGGAAKTKGASCSCKIPVHEPVPSGPRGLVLVQPYNRYIWWKLLDKCSALLLNGLKVSWVWHLCSTYTSNSTTYWWSWMEQDTIQASSLLHIHHTRQRNVRYSTVTTPSK